MDTLCREENKLNRKLLIPSQLYSLYPNCFAEQNYLFSNHCF